MLLSLIIQLFHYRMQPELPCFLGTLESCKVIEMLSPNTMIFHQLYKRVWPSSQRETLFMSHIREIPSSGVSLERLEYEVGNPWLSINYSIEHPDIPVSFQFLHCAKRFSKTTPGGVHKCPSPQQQCEI